MSPKLILKQIIFIILCLSFNPINAQNKDFNPIEILQSPDSNSNSQTTNSNDIFKYSLHDLMQMKITSVSKSSENVNNAPMSVYVMNADEIKRLGTRGLYETLDRSPGIDFYNVDAYGQAGVLTRGLPSIWRYGYSIEWMPILDYGHTIFPRHFFKSAEITRGPGGFTWGASANVGFTNINIRDDLDGVEIVSELGNSGYTNNSFMYGKNFGSQSLFVGINRVEQNYQTERNSFSIPDQKWLSNGILPSYNFLVNYKSKNFKVIVNHEHADHIVPSFWIGTEYKRNSITNEWNLTPQGRYKDSVETVTNQRLHDQLISTSARIEYHLPLKSSKIDIYAFDNYNKSTWFLESFGIVGREKNTVGLGVNLNLIPEKLTINSGSDLLDITLNQQHSTNTRVALENNINGIDAQLEPTKVMSRNIYSQLNYNLTPSLKLISGLRCDFQKIKDKSYQNYSYRLGTSYNLTDHFVIKYFYNQAPRTPQINEIVKQSNIHAEKLSAHEISTNINKQAFNATITAYYQVLTDAITRNQENGYINASGMKTFGFEYSIKYIFQNNLLFYANGNLIHSRTIKSDFINTVGISNTKNEPLFVPVWGNLVGTEVKVKQLFKFNLDWRYKYKIAYIDINNKEDYKNMSMFDLSISSFRIKKYFEIGFSCLNLLNNRNPLPAFGEHSNNQNGTVLPEGRRFYMRLSFFIPNKK